MIMGVSAGIGKASTPLMLEQGCRVDKILFRITWYLHTSADPNEALALECLLNQRLNSGNVTDQFLRDSVASLKIGDAGSTHPYPIIITLPDEDFQGQIKSEERGSNHQRSARFRIAKDQHMGLLHLEADSFCFSTMVNMGKEAQIATADGLLEAHYRLFYRKRTGSGQNSFYRGRGSR